MVSESTLVSKSEELEALGAIIGLSIGLARSLIFGAPWSKATLLVCCLGTGIDIGLGLKETREDLGSYI